MTPKEQSQERIASILADLSLDEKIALMSGEDMWSTIAIEHAGVPKLKLTDGPSGARGAFASETRTTCFPVGVAMAASWNVDLLHEIGVALGKETKVKGAQVLLGPTINLQRTPIGGRNFESYSEDPVLAGALAVSFIGGVQSQGVGACPKHYVANDTEFERHSISSDLDNRTLRELYLAPFESAVKEGAAWSIMSAYNKINGTFASSHDELVNGVLRAEWGFDGVVVSDWGAALETVANANGGLDLEMPGPPRIWGEQLRIAVENGQVHPDVIDQHVRNLLLLMERVGALDEVPDYEERSDEIPLHRELARRAAAESMILVKNEGNLLPLNPAPAQRVAIVGPNAKISQIQGGGSSTVRPHHVVNILEGLNSGFSNSEITYEPGCLIHKYLPAFDANLIASVDGVSGGFTSERYENESFSGEPSVTIETSNRLFLFGAIGVVGPSEGVSIRLSGIFTPDRSGVHSFGVVSAGLARLFIDKEEVVDNWAAQTPGDSFFGFGSAEKIAQAELEAGRAYNICIEFVRPSTGLVGGLRFGVLPPIPEGLIARAADVARNADITVLVLGTNADWETEGNDRTDMQLPGDQNALAEAILDADPNAIIVVNAGAPMEMPWLDRAKVLIWAWFPGQEFGNALFDVICGASEPGGRSPISFPKSLKDHPAFGHYPGVDGHMPYEEGLFIGYRHYDLESSQAPLIPFGHGLGYADISHLSLVVDDEAQAGMPVKVRVEIKNNSARSGADVVQLYVHPVNPEVRRPFKELKAFRKIVLGANEAETIDLELAVRAFSYWDDGEKAWRCDPGEYEILIGHSAEDITLRTTIQLTAV
jgi:beta-glucosidase